MSPFPGKAWRRRLVLDEMLANIEPEVASYVREGLPPSMRDVPEETLRPILRARLRELFLERDLPGRLPITSGKEAGEFVSREMHELTEPLLDRLTNDLERLGW